VDWFRLPLGKLAPPVEINESCSYFDNIGPTLTTSNGSHTLVMQELQIRSCESFEQEKQLAEVLLTSSSITAIVVQNPPVTERTTKDGFPHTTTGFARTFAPTHSLGREGLSTLVVLGQWGGGRKAKVLPPPGDTLKWAVFRCQ
jgi:hypothetical protein